jgi:hypothetical protein
MRIIFCFNQISYHIAKNLKNDYYLNDIIIYSKGRISIAPSKSKSIQLPYSTLLAFFVLVIISIFKDIEVVIPHARSGRLINKLYSKSCNLSFIDDGMDTFRNVPKNIDLKKLNFETKFYTFDYKIPLADWVYSVQLVKTVPITSLAFDHRPSVDLSYFQNVVVESPGIPSCFLSTLNGTSIIFQHPNHNKRDENTPIKNRESNLLLSVEKSIISSDINVVIGDTLVFIFLLESGYNVKKIHLFLRKETYLNMSNLHSIFTSIPKITLLD